MAERKRNPRQDAAGSLLLPGRISSGDDSSPDGAFDTSDPSAVDGAPSSAKKGGEDGKANAPVAKKGEKEDVSFSFLMDSIPLCLLYTQPKLSIALGA